MSLEKDIHQARFRNDFQKVVVNVLYTASWVQEQMKNFLKAEDITPQQYNILRILKGSNKPISTLQIRERMLDKMSDTSRLAERLQKKGLVNKATSAEDKRLVDITITAQGLAVLQRLDERNHDLDAIASNHLSAEEAATLNLLLDKMRIH
jgi:DNA-binding MarR family transcriptional regulator